jgi:hypothetical protein
VSNSLGIATVTSCFRAVLENAFTNPNNVDDTLSNATVTTLSPSVEEGAGLPNPGANVFLFQITPSAAGRNVDLPTRDSRGELVMRPRVALELHYLITFYGDNATLEPQRLLGIAVRVLHRQPVFSPSVVDQAITQLVNSHPTLGFLNRSNLAAALEPIRVTPIALTADELSRIWSVFSFQTGFALSLAYQASLLFVDSDELGRTALPVKTTNVYVDAGGPPQIDRVFPQADPTGPIVPGATLLVVGRGFGNSVTDIEVVLDGDHIAPLTVSPTQLTFALPASLEAGTHSLQVARFRLMGSPPTPHQGLLSNRLPLVLLPAVVSSQVTFVFGSPSDPDDDPPPEVIDGVTFVSGTLTVFVTPDVGRRQTVVVFLNELPGSVSPPSGRAYTLPVEARKETDPTDRVAVRFRQVAAGDYLVRVQVDGATSALAADPTTGLFISPFVTVPIP